ncbi:MAG: multiheme c-type cytochrome [Gemmataceae bacterium]
MKIARAYVLLLPAGILACLWAVAPKSWGVPTGPAGPVVASSASGALPQAKITAHGIAGCSAQACHGAPEPVDSANDVSKSAYAFTRWINHDKHAEAFRSLFNDRSVRMAKNLGIKTAHEDARCLACHTIPATVYSGQWGEVAFDARSVNLRRDGIGCESCHGIAEESWLRPHTTTAFKNSTARKGEYDKYGMTWLNDLATRAQTCAGCHVGAPADPTNNIPLRDVDHDLIAAGHPRLNFEFSTYLANMPPHWVEKDRNKPESANLRKDLEPLFEAHVWEVGQVETTRASLELLRYHAGQDSSGAYPHKQWPEFAEHDCFACHHDLLSKSWRVEAKDYYKNRKPGAPPISPWNLSLPLRKLLADAKSLETVREEMSTSLPDRTKVANAAKVAEAALMLNPSKNAKDLKQQMAKVIPATDEELNRLTWDDAAQIYYALTELGLAQNAPDAAFNKHLKELGDNLSFTHSHDSVRDDSPRNFRRPPSDSGEKVREALKKLRALLVR